MCSLKLVDALELPLDLGISRSCFKPLVLNLLLGPAPFGRCFHKVGASTFGGADVVAGLEDGEDARIHFNNLVLLLEHPLVSHIDLLVYPGFKRHSYQGIDNGDDILTWQLQDFIFRRKSTSDDGIDLGKSEEVGDGKAFELRDVVDFDVVGLDDRLLSLSKIS